jgi:hypothetical protein
MENSKLLYEKIGKTWCPALHDYIAFNRAGFQHLLRKRGRRRTETEKKRRLALLPFIKNVIANPNVKIYHEKKISLFQSNQHGEKIQTSGEVEFWKLSGIKNGRTINVIIRKINRGQKHFFSVY